MIDAIMYVVRFAIILPIVLLGLIGWTVKNRPDWLWQAPLLLLALLIVAFIVMLIAASIRMDRDYRRKEREANQKAADEHCYRVLPPPQ